MHKRLCVYFSGTVQGVGFRFTTDRIARAFEISGYVRNLPNGKVELVAEGEEGAAQDFLTAILQSHMGSFIREVETHWTESEGEFKGFRIRA